MPTAHPHPSFDAGHLASCPPSGWPHRAFGSGTPLRQMPARDRATNCRTCGKLGHARPAGWGSSTKLKTCGKLRHVWAVGWSGLAPCEPPAAYCGMPGRQASSNPIPAANWGMLGRSLPARPPSLRHNPFPAAEDLGVKSVPTARAAGEVHAKICCILRYARTIGTHELAKPGANWGMLARPLHFPPNAPLKLPSPGGSGVGGEVRHPLRRGCGPSQTHNLRRTGACPDASFARVPSPPPFAPRQRSHGCGPASRTVFVRGAVARFGLSGGRAQASRPITKRGAVPARIIAWHIPCSCDNRGDRATE
jgi:hypothetical protein